MCLIVFALNKHPRYKLILAANRDEFYERPTEPVNWWDENPEMLAGKDLVAGGTWLGITKSGKFAAITNYREFPQKRKFESSRGKLVKKYLSENLSSENFLEFLENKKADYDGFNLLFGHTDELHYFSNKGQHKTHLPSGIYGLSNHLLDTEWPKVNRAKESLESIISKNYFSTESIFEMLDDRTIANNNDLPETGIGMEWESVLSPIFIKTEKYGTRCSTVLLIDKNNQVTFEERSYIPSAKNKFEFTVE